MNPAIRKALDSFYMGYLKSIFSRVYCPVCDNTGKPSLGLKVEILTSLADGLGHLHAHCPVCNSYYNLGDMNILKEFQRASHSGGRKPLINLRNLKYSERYSLK